MILVDGVCQTVAVTILPILILHQAQDQVILLTALTTTPLVLLLPVLAILEEITTLTRAILMEPPATMAAPLLTTQLIHLQAQYQVQDLNQFQLASVPAGITG